MGTKNQSNKDDANGQEPRIRLSGSEHEDKEALFRFRTWVQSIKGKIVLWIPGFGYHIKEIPEPDIHSDYEIVDGELIPLDRRKE